jgi:hypothetical protein
MKRNALRCETLPIGIIGTSYVDPLGVPDMPECMMLIAAAAIFFAAGRSIFETWGKPPTEIAANVPENTGPVSVLPA